MKSRDSKLSGTFALWNMEALFSLLTTIRTEMKWKCLNKLPKNAVYHKWPEGCSVLIGLHFLVCPCKFIGANGHAVHNLDHPCALLRVGPELFG